MRFQASPPRAVIVGLLVAACSTELAATPQPSVNSNADPQLAARIPTSVGGEPFEVETFRDAATLLLMGVNESFLEELAVEIGDVSVALGHRPMADETSVHLSTYAYRVVGVSESALTAFFIPIMEGQSEDIPLEEASVGGKEVWRPVGIPVAVAGNMLYVHGDTAYLIYGDRRDVSELLLAALP